MITQAELAAIVGENDQREAMIRDAVAAIPHAELMFFLQSVSLSIVRARYAGDAHTELMGHCVLAGVVRALASNKESD